MLTPTQQILPEILHQQVRLLRKRVYQAGISASELAEITEVLSPYASQLYKKPNMELLAVRNLAGDWEEHQVVRWLCHFLALPHRCVHILVFWARADGTAWPLVQIRSLDKDDSPGHMDLSSAGHVVGKASLMEAAQSELFEELGLGFEDLEGGALQETGSYAYYGEKPDLRFYNAEYRHCYTGRISTETIEKIYFEDGEVSGLMVLPQAEVARMIRQGKLPMASGLRESFPRIMDWMGE